MKKTMMRFVLSTASVAMLLCGTSASATQADDNIKLSFEKTYVFRTYLKDDGGKFDVEKGVVTLTGTVKEESHKELANETAVNLPGVVGVKNRLIIDTPNSKTSDAWIGGKVKVTLMFHRNVNGTGTLIGVKNGVVTLKGRASSLAQKELTGEYAADIDGVKKVNNRMTVSSAKKPAEQTLGEKIDDASITGQVKTALMTHRSTSTMNTKVATRDGEVTLTGIAKNSAEKSLVSKLVGDIQGVTGVENKMTVQ
jgi:osmotically-inducible protein OsmY